MSAKRMPAAELRDALDRFVLMLEAARDHSHAKANTGGSSMSHVRGMADGVELALGFLHFVTGGEFGRDEGSWREPDPSQQLGEAAGAGPAGGAA